MFFKHLAILSISLLLSRRKVNKLTWHQTYFEECIPTKEAYKKKVTKSRNYHEELNYLIPNEKQTNKKKKN